MLSLTMVLLYMQVNPIPLTLIQISLSFPNLTWYSSWYTLDGSNDSEHFATIISLKLNNSNSIAINRYTNNNIYPDHSTLVEI